MVRGVLGMRAAVTAVAVLVWSPGIAHAALSDPYAQAVLADAPSTYLRLDESGGPIANDSSGNGNDATFESGTAFGVPGPLASVAGDTAIDWPDTGVGITQSGDELPAQNTERTVEFWWRTINCQAGPHIRYGGPASGDEQFEVRLNPGNCNRSNLELDTGGQTAIWPLPQAWTDGRWHFYDVTYDGSRAVGYMDGQIVGSTPMTALATATPGNGFSISDFSGHPDKPDGIAELAVYPVALSPARVDAHWTAAAIKTCADSPADAYGQSVVSDGPALYLRLDDLVNDPAGRVAYDSSGRCTPSAPANGAYMAGTAGEADGVSLGHPTGAVSVSDPTGPQIVSQSGPDLPSGDTSRTIEFWSRTIDCQASESVHYGNSAITDGVFAVQVNAGNCQSSRMVLDTVGQNLQWPLPAAWDDGAWHLFDLAYDGATARAFMDGQLVGSRDVPTRLATVAPGDGLAVNAGAHTGKPDAIAELAVYPTALSSKSVNAHWKARFALPADRFLIAGTARFGDGTGAQGARAQACPASGASCVVASVPSDPSGFFHLLAPAGTYTLTIFPPPGSPSGPQTIPHVTVPPSAQTLSATFSPPDGLPPGVTLSTPSSGPQQNQVPTVNWSEPTTITTTGCPNGLGVATAISTNPATGQPERISVPLVETPSGSGNYQGTLPPLAPSHGAANGTDVVFCPPKLGLLPSGGPLRGGTKVVLNGAGFTGATEVKFGATLASSFSVTTDNFIEATSPAGSGSVPVTVKLRTGDVVTVGIYTYFQVNSSTPTSGPSTGGTVVTIDGKGFSDGAAVVFGFAASRSVRVVSPTEIQAVAPAGIGKVNVQVLQGTALSEASDRAVFTYENSPAGTGTLDQTTTPPQLYQAQVVRACGLLTVVEQTGVLCDTSQAAEGYEGLSENARDLAEHVIVEALQRQFAAFLSFGLAELFGDYAAGAVAFNTFETIFGIVNPVAKAILIFEIGDNACKVFTGHGCRWDFWTLFIDPSGNVVDAGGNPVAGASATLLSRPSEGGAFSPVDPAGGTIRPAVNPQTTGPSGAFEWDALAGTYEVEASAPGCHAPGDASKPIVFTSPFAIPPPAVGLLLTLQCPGSPPPPRPSVTRVDEAAGPAAGGNTVSITGTGLAGATSVRFGDTAVTQLQVLSPYAISAVAPAGSGTVDVTVTTPGGTSATNDADGYAYLAPRPVQGGPAVTGVSPDTGPQAGGTVVTITGTGLGDAFAVDFGGAHSPVVTDVSSTEVRAVAPAAAFPMRVDITVRTPTGGSAPVATDWFTYGSPPAASLPTVTVSAAPNPAALHHDVALRAAVSPTDGGGTVAFHHDGSTTPIEGCDALPLHVGGSGFAATCSTSRLAAGVHMVTATYSGDAGYDSNNGTTSVTITDTPLNTSPPVIFGNKTVGRKLSASAGTWSGATPMTFGYRWQRCRTQCADIARATARAYRLAEADVGARIRVVVTASNVAGSSAATAIGVGPVIPNTAQIRAALANLLHPEGRSARATAIRRAGGYRATFSAPSAGDLVVRWSRHRVVVAKLRRVVRRAHAATVNVRLTSRGRRLLQRSRRSRLTIAVAFTPVGGVRFAERAAVALEP